MKILLTGREGQVGREMALLLEERGIHVAAFSRQQLDITSPIEIVRQMDTVAPTCVINLAAYTRVDQAEVDRDRAFAVNSRGPNFLSELCHERNVPLIHVSTDYVFNGASEVPYREDCQTNPINVYGESKWMGEEAIRQHCPHHVILRTSWVFGRYGHNFVKTILNKAVEKNELKLVNDQIGCPTSAMDIARVILQICEAIEMKRAHWGTYHYCNAEPTTWYDFAKEIMTMANQYHDIEQDVKLTPIATSNYFTLAKRPMYSVLSVEKIKRDYGIIPQSWKLPLQTVIQEIAYDLSAS